MDSNSTYTKYNKIYYIYNQINPVRSTIKKIPNKKIPNNTVFSFASISCLHYQPKLTNRKYKAEVESDTEVDCE